jgi:hypothetical protein
MSESQEIEQKTIDLGGRPPFFETPEKLQEAISEYFITGVKKRKVVVGKGEQRRIEEIEVPTITGLCYALGFESRQSFYDYEQKEGFAYTIKRARLFIENEYEEQLSVGNTIGAIFALKNFGWSDEHNLNIRGSLSLVDVAAKMGIDDES